MNRKNYIINQDVKEKLKLITGFNDRAGVQFRVKALTPEAVAKEAVFGLLTGKLLIIPGLMMRVGVAASKLVPEKLLSRILYHVQAAKQPEHK